MYVCIYVNICMHAYGLKHMCASGRCVGLLNACQSVRVCMYVCIYVNICMHEYGLKHMCASGRSVGLN